MLADIPGRLFLGIAARIDQRVKCCGAFVAAAMGMI